MTGTELTFEGGSRQWDAESDAVRFVAYVQRQRVNFILPRSQLQAMDEIAGSGGSREILGSFDDNHGRILAAAHYVWRRDGGRSETYEITAEDIATVGL